MSPTKGPGTAQFSAAIGDAEGRWRRKVLPKIESSASLQARVDQDPFLRAGYAVLTAGTDEEARTGAQHWRDAWFPFHGLSEDTRTRITWLRNLQQATATEAQERGDDEEGVNGILSQQSLWLAVLRSPLNITEDAAWKEARRRWIHESQEDVLSPIDAPYAPPRRAHIPFEPPSPERGFAETRLLAMESLHTAILCEEVDDQLSDEQKTIMRMTYVIGLMEDEIADQTGLAVDEVIHLKRQALAALRARAVE